MSADIPLGDKPTSILWTPEPIVGWRGYMCRQLSRAVVLSGMYDQIWWSTELEATHRIFGIPEIIFDGASETHKVPEWSCTCGIYATKELHYLPWPMSSVVLARVALTGKVIEHEYGYRAQHARVIKFIVSATETWPRSSKLQGIRYTRKMARKIERTYGVPVEMVNRWSDLVDLWVLYD